MNFNLNSINKKIVLYLSLIGFILSFISGLLSGNNFSILIVRSLISGVFIGIVSMIANIVVIIYLPELLESQGDDDIEDGEGDSHVDIVMPEEKYEVQAGEGNHPEDGVGGEESNSEFTSSSFKEVDLDNLKSLSSSGGTSGIVSQDFSDDGGEDSTAPSNSTASSSGTEPDMGNFSPEEYAKAVRTKLKKD